MPPQRLSIRIDSRLESKLQRASAASLKSQSDLVREALEQYLESQPIANSCYELARKSRLVGCVKAAPADLSTNRNHFDGFGTA
jgi:metal-responsive CopG/Arc/MetJ family transcriptional regulator